MDELDPTDRGRLYNEFLLNESDPRLVAENCRAYLREHPFTGHPTTGEQVRAALYLFGQDPGADDLDQHAIIDSADARSERLDYPHVQAHLQAARQRVTEIFAEQESAP